MKSKAPMMNMPPNGEAILAYAIQCGLQNPRFEWSGLFGWDLIGEGRSKSDWPLVWAVAQECGIAWGAGSTNHHQIKPELFRQPKEVLE